jgi:hypothetical protein
MTPAFSLHLILYAEIVSMKRAFQVTAPPAVSGFDKMLPPAAIVSGGGRRCWRILYAARAALKSDQ